MYRIVPIYKMYPRNTAIITKQGIFMRVDDLIPGRNGIDTTLNKIRHFFTLKYPMRQFFVTNSQFRKCTINGVMYILLPRFLTYKVLSEELFLISSGKKVYVKDILGMKKICRTINNIKVLNEIDIGPSNIVLKVHQDIIIRHILRTIYSQDNVSKGNGGLILKLDTGLGKSFIALKLLEILSCRTLIVVPNTNILEDWAEKIKNVFPGIRIGFQYARFKCLGSVVVGIVDSLIKKNIPIEVKSIDINPGHKRYSSISKKITKKNYVTLLPEEYYDLFDFVVFDECDYFVCKKFSKVFQRSQSPYMLGLSATPEDRADGFHKIAKWWIGDILDAKDIPGYSIGDIKFVGDVTAYYFNAKMRYTTYLTNKQGEISFQSLIENITQDPYRMELILREIKKQYNDNQNTFVFAERRQYLIDLQELCHLYGIPTTIIGEDEQSDVAVEHLLGGTSRERMKSIEKEARIILTTYQYYGVGKSLPKMTAAIYATPRKSKAMQYIGRILRLGSDSTIRRRVIDIVDRNTILAKQFASRRKVYIKKGFSVTTIKENYTNFSYLPLIALFMSRHTILAPFTSIIISYITSI